MTIGDKIRFYRERKGWSQTQLALKVGYKSASAVAKIEAGARDVKQNKIQEFANALGVSPADLLDLETDEQEMIQDELYGEYRILFDLTKKVKPEDLDMVKQFLERLTKNE